MITYDCKRISNTLSEVAVKKVCDYLNQNQMCRFELIEEEDTTVEQYIEMAGKLKELGVKIDVQKLKQLVKIGFHFRR